MQNHQIVYHGTSLESFQNIMNQGFKVGYSNYLQLGEGIYFTYNKENAKMYGKMIIKCLINPGKVKEISYNGQYLQKSWQLNGYDSAYVPEGNDEFSQRGYSQICIKSPNQVIKILDYESNN